MWSRSSSFSSRSTWSRRKSERTRKGSEYNHSKIISSLLELDDSGDSSGQTIPVGRLFFELLPPEPRQRIKLSATVVATRLPLSGNPTPMFQLVQGRVERAIANP